MSHAEFSHCQIPRLLHIKMVSVVKYIACYVSIESDNNFCVYEYQIFSILFVTTKVPKRGHLVSWSRVIWVWPN